MSLVGIHRVGSTTEHKAHYSPAGRALIVSVYKEAPSRLHLHQNAPHAFYYLNGLLPSPSHYTQPVLVVERLNQSSHRPPSGPPLPPGCLFWCNANTWKRFTRTPETSPRRRQTRRLEAARRGDVSSDGRCCALSLPLHRYNNHGGGGGRWWVGAAPDASRSSNK